MARRFDCPWGGYIELPDEWLGAHAERRDRAREQAAEKKLPQTLANFTVALALLENWGGIEGLSGNPDKWDLGAVKWGLINWLTDTVFTDLAIAFMVPKNFSPPSPVGLTAEAEKTGQPGTSESEPPG